EENFPKERQKVSHGSPFLRETTGKAPSIRPLNFGVTSWFAGNLPGFLHRKNRGYSPQRTASRQGGARWKDLPEGGILSNPISCSTSREYGIPGHSYHEFQYRNSPHPK